MLRKLIKPIRIVCAAALVIGWYKILQALVD